MTKKQSSLSSYGPPISLLILVCALYMKKPEFRHFVDEKLPWIKDTLEKITPPSAGGGDGTTGPGSDPGTAQPPPWSSAPDASGAPTFDLQKVAANPALWPKTITLKINAYFPAVLDGKEVGGILTAPKGSEVKVVTIRGGKVGLEYRGGGAWVDIRYTDFEERVRHGLH